MSQSKRAGEFLGPSKESADAQGHNIKLTKEQEGVKRIGEI